ncbi:MAG: lysophospholipid acyltransferase family protein [Thermodesulfobacteriota bacterium]
MTLFFLKAVAFVLGCLPRGLTLPLGRALGRLVCRLDKKRALVARENIRRAFPEMADAEVDRIASEVFANLGAMLFEFMRIPWLGKGSLGPLVEFEGMEHFTRAAQKNKGVILVTAHFGNWELMAAAVGMFIHPVDIVARDLDHPALEEFVSWVRQRAGNRIVSKSRAMRKLLKSLSNGGVVGILLDQNVARREGVFVDFFSTPACTNKGPALLAAASGAPMVPIFNVPEGNGYRIIIQEEIEMAMTGDKEQDAVTNTARCTEAIEQMIRAHPEQWFWVHRRWKTRPLKEKKP